jgi:UDP-hydrolysing UDP-N-acetyl-D-glucosamine 2-epimerase
VDNQFRHAITKLAYWHFPICELHASRIVAMGEDPARIFDLGAPAVDNLVDLMSLEECEEALGYKIKRPFALVCYHPETLSSKSIMAQFQDVIHALPPRGSVIVSGANQDAGGGEINELWQSVSRVPLIGKNIMFRKTYDSHLWNSLMSHADVLIGNSSAFVIEGMTLGKKTIMVGDRQKGRYEDALKMFAPTQKDLDDEFYTPTSRKYVFGVPGTVSEQIAKKLLEVEIPKPLRKAFYD